MERLGRDEYFMSLARGAARRGTCIRRKVGCILVDVYGKIAATGYNGTPRGFPHCDALDSVCEGRDSASGVDLGLCTAVHAEQNALIQCRNEMELQTAYCSTEPCRHCTKMLLNTTVQRVVYCDSYSNNGRDLWEQVGREWIKFNERTE